MADDSWPSTAHNTRNVTETEYEKIHVRGADDGIYGDPAADTAVVVAGVGRQVTVRGGRSGHLRGQHWTSGATDYTHTITANASGSTRVDRVVLQLDRDDDHKVRTAISQGTPGSGAPALVQQTGDTGKYQIPLATVTIANNASSVTVARQELWVGARTRPCTATTRPPNPKRGEIAFETDTGRWVGWTGSAWETVYEDSGLLDLTIGFSTTWEFSAASRGRKVGGTVSLRLAAKRKGEDFLVGDADGSHVATVPAALRPYQFEYGHAGFTNGAVGTAEVRTDGEVWVKDITKTVPKDHILHSTITYLLP